MITIEELLAKCFGGQPDKDLFHVAIWEILTTINRVRVKYKSPMIVTCFFRTPEWDISKGRSGKSAHTLCLAVDIADQDGKLAKWVMRNLMLMENLGLYIEDPAYTSVWVHFQKLAPKSGRRVFIP